MALRDKDLVRRVVADDANALARRRSTFENEQTPVHAAFAPPHGVGVLAGTPDYDMLALLMELGADVKNQLSHRSAALKKLRAWGGW